MKMLQIGIKDQMIEFAIHLTWHLTIHVGRGEKSHSTYKCHKAGGKHVLKEYCFSAIALNNYESM